MQAAGADEPSPLRHPRTRQPAGTLHADELLTRIARAAWQTGDPGLIFLDAINRSNPTPAVGSIEATNPCGEVPLLPYEACNLGSINLSHMVRKEGAEYAMDWRKLAETARLGVRFLDDVIDVGRWPAPQIESATRANRKIGLGVMGFAELLFLLEVPYASEQSLSLAEELMRFIAAASLAASQQLAQERGVFPNWEQSVHLTPQPPSPNRRGGQGGEVHAGQGMRVRNATRTSIAPTGTLSILAGTSASIEPLFALAYRRHALDGQVLIEINPLFLRYARERGFYSHRLVQDLQARGSLAGLDYVPPEAKELFATALEIAPEAHLRIQAAFQKHVDNAVSKTINLPQTATPEDVARIYRQAWQAGLKGITMFRYGSKGQQVLELGMGQTETGEEHEHFARCDPGACKV